MNFEEENAFQLSNKFPSFDHADNGRSSDQTMDEDKEKSGRKRSNRGSIELGRFCSWPASSRIVRVPRAYGGKDRHSKVVTSKGLRDRRVRLSVNTAIQFYDLQDRLGYDQPSKAVEWLLKAAESSISELPPMPNNPFPDTPKCHEKRSSSTIGINGGSDHLVLEDLDHPSVAAGEAGDCGGNNYHQQVANKSCSSASTETSKGSGLSLSRSEIRVKARERAKERVAEKDKETTTTTCLNVSSQPITKLLSSGMDNNNNSCPNSGSGGGTLNASNVFLKSPRRHWSSSSTTTPPMDYFTNVLQMQLASNPPITSPMFSVTGDNNHNGGVQHFSFVPDHMVRHSYNNNSHDQQNSTLNFTISSNTIDGYNRGTLQSNSSSSSSSSISLPSLQLPQRFPNIDGSPQNLFFAPMDSNSNVSHYQFLSAGYDAGRLQLCYGDPNQHGNIYNARHSKGKGKH